MIFQKTRRQSLTLVSSGRAIESNGRTQSPTTTGPASAMGGVLLLIAASWLLIVPSGTTAANRLTLRDGFQVVGDVEIEDSRIVVRSGPRTLYIGSQQLLKPEPADDRELPERFTLDQPYARNVRPVGMVTEIARIGEFDEFGRRTIVLRDGRNQEVPIIQGVTELYPTHVVLRGIKYTWQTRLALFRVPSKPLLAMLYKAIDPSNGPDHLKVANFLIQAERFEEARAELATLKQQFPDASSQTEELSDKLERRATERALLLMGRAVGAGQLERARKIAASLENHEVPGDLEPKVKLFQQELATMAAKRARSLQILKAISTVGSDPSQDNVSREALDEIVSNLSLVNQDRLAPMLLLSEQPSASDADRLALAISGWALGPKLANQDLQQATSFWERREILQSAIQTADEVEFQASLQELAKRQTKVDVALQMIPLLPARPTDLKPGMDTVIPCQTAEFPELKYHVALPPEYDRFREYPTVVTLHGLKTTPQDQLAMWKPLAAEHGYIVVAPEYRLDATRPYEYSVREHVAFLAILADVRRRFAVDSDRVFLSGHELGGFAAWDLGMSHPDQFAGLIPFTSSPMFYGEHYWPNLAYLPLYVVEGSLNGDNPTQTQSQFLRYFKGGFDAIYVEYSGRGREMYQDELPTIFDWMSRKRRNPIPSELEVVTARHCDRQFFWLQAESFLPNATVAPALFQRSRFRAAKLKGNVTDGNQIVITSSGLSELTVLLAPQLVHLDDPNLSIRANRKIIHKGPIEPDMETMLREIRRTGDRKKLVIKKVQVSRL